MKNLFKKVSTKISAIRMASVAPINIGLAIGAVALFLSGSNTIAYSLIIVMWLLLIVATRNEIMITMQENLELRKENIDLLARHEFIQTLMNHLEKDLIDFKVLKKVTYEDYQKFGEKDAKIKVEDIVSPKIYNRLREAASLAKVISMGMDLSEKLMRESNKVKGKYDKSKPIEKVARDPEMDKRANDILNKVFGKKKEGDLDEESKT